MSEKQAKKHLRQMLRDFTPGSILHLLADIFGESAEEVRREDDEMAYQRCMEVKSTLFCVGLGIDAVVSR